ncbi:hypothetical protein KGM_201867 [Danaus plexippus plexippus]|uniref:Uncharacterized protein n=1 Tax=Danaus plexippus plexippus TaxID=278856 RepID=A0A212FBT2_DANPL|nr:hypothetical protein KGM_201867 [Danaus plexippus plexippus]
MSHRLCKVSGDSLVMDFKDGKSIGSNSSGETNSTLRCRLLIGCGWRRRDGGGTAAWFPSLAPTSPRRPPTSLILLQSQTCVCFMFNTICPFGRLIFFGVVIKLGPVRGRGGCQAALQLGVAGCGVRLSTGLPSPRNGSVFRRESRSSPVPRRDSVTRLVRDSVMQCFCHSCRAPVLPAGWNFAKTGVGFLEISRCLSGRRRHDGYEIETPTSYKS